MSGAAEALDGCLHRHDVQKQNILAIPGGAICAHYDALASQAEPRAASSTSWCATSQGGTHAADCLRPPPPAEVRGAVSEPQAPAATNLWVHGIATAQMDSVPIVVITEPGGRASIGNRCLPGKPTSSHHSADREAFLGGARSAQIGRIVAEAFSDRSHRPARSVRSSPQGCGSRSLCL